jgi:hypothetical protein
MIVRHFNNEKRDSGYDSATFQQRKTQSVVMIVRHFNNEKRDSGYDSATYFKNEKGTVLL